MGDPQATIDDTKTNRRKSFVQMSGWILVLTIVGIWVCVGRLLQIGAEKPQLTSATYVVDINRATKADLLNLPEVGPALASRILRYRDEHGDFQQLADIRKVPGVGPQTLKELAVFLSFPEPQIEQQERIAP